MRLCGPAIYGASAGIVVGDHPIGVYGTVAMATSADSASLIGSVSGLCFLWKKGECEKSGQDYHYGCECFSFHCSQD